MVDRRVDHRRHAVSVVGAPLRSPSPELAAEPDMQGALVNYYNRHIGDYAAATRHLSILDHGVYTLLMDRYYSDERPLPTDPAEAARLIGARTRQEIASVRLVLQDFFTVSDDGWRQNRCEAEITAYQAFIAKQSANGKASAAKRKRQPKSNGGSTIVQPALNDRTTTAITVGQPPTPTPTLSEDLRSSAGSPPGDPRKALWDLGKSILGVDAGSIIGAAIKRVKEARVGEVLGQMAVKPPADPKTWFIKATQERGVVV